jgi:hypothetical protein
MPAASSLPRRAAMARAVRAPSYAGWKVAAKASK